MDTKTYELQGYDLGEAGPSYKFISLHSSLNDATKAAVKLRRKKKKNYIIRIKITTVIYEVLY